MRHRDVVLGVAEPKEKGLQSLHLLPFGCYIFFPALTPRRAHAFRRAGKPTRRRAGAQRVAGVAPMQTHTTVKAELDALRAERATLQGKIDALARYQGLLDR